ncbi:MAG TPA: septation protein IspZ [Bacteroidales bacterium]|nr:septation protein IspZ [Bacteroidales bacterium]
MNRKLLLQLLPGFIPLFIFIVADEIWGTKVGLLVAVASGIIELIIYRVRDGKFDKFILLDTLLIVILGVISIILDNDVFFKLKPALIGVLMCAVLGISAFTPNNYLLMMSKRYMKGVEMNDQQYLKFRQNLRTLFWIFSAYTILVFYSVWFMSKEAWAFISGGLFYILFGVYFLFEMAKIWRMKKQQQNEEWLPLVNEKGEIIGKAPRSVCHSDKKYLHPVVHLHVINDKGEIVLQKRPLTKTIQPGKWDTAVGGHVAFDETIELALKRESEEEIGLHDFDPKLVANYIWESDVEREFVFCFITRHNGPINPHKKELAGAGFWTVPDIKASLGKGIFTPNFEEEFKRFLVKF